MTKHDQGRHRGATRIARVPGDEFAREFRPGREIGLACLDALTPRT